MSIGHGIYFIRNVDLYRVSVRAGKNNLSAGNEEIAIRMETNRPAETECNVRLRFSRLVTSSDIDNILYNDELTGWNGTNELSL